MSSSKLTVVLVGATGTLGSSVAAGFLRPEYASQVDLRLLVRQATANTAGPKKDALDALQAKGATLVYGDVATSTDAELAAALNGADVIVSAVGGAQLGSDQLRLITAAKSANVRWFVPSEFGFDGAAVGRGSSVAPIFDPKLDALEAVKKAGLDWTIVSSGAFAEYAVTPFFGVDQASSTITAPGSFSSRASITPLAEIGRITADAIVTGRGRNAHVFTGEAVSYEQIASALEKATGRSFTRQVRSLADAEAALEKNSNDFVARFAILLAKQPAGITWTQEQTYAVKHQLKPLQTFDEFVTQAVAAATKQ